MDFFKEIFNFSCKLILVVVFCAWYYEKIIVPRRQANKPKQPEHPPYTPSEVFSAYRVYYEDMAYCLYDCLRSVGRICFLNCPNDVQKISAARVDDRVKKLHGKIVFCYEVERTEVQSPIGKKQAYSTSCADIADILKSNLPAYLTPGLGFSNVYVVDIGNDYVRIMVENVTKVIDCNNFYVGEDWYYDGY